MFPGGRDPKERQARDAQRAFNKQQAAQGAHIQRLANELHQTRSYVLNQQPSGRAAVDALQAHEVHYANTILLLAYGGFFALWGSTAGNMPKGWFGLSGVLMGLSVIGFIGFEVAKTIGNSLAIRKGLERDEQGRPLMSEHDVIALANRNTDSVNRYWLFAFLPSLATGLAAGFIVLWFFGAHALRGEWKYPPASTEKAIQAPATPGPAMPAIQKTNQAKSKESKDSARN